MKVRSNCSESANQSRLLSRDKVLSFNAFIHFSGDKLTHGTFACSAIKIATILTQNLNWAACTVIDGLARAFLVDVVANANDHENYLQLWALRVNSKCE